MNEWRYERKRKQVPLSKRKILILGWRLPASAPVRSSEVLPEVFVLVL